jgi:hypothetical protein
MRRGFLWLLAAGAVFVVAGAGFVVWDRDFRRAGSANPGMNCPSVVPAHARQPFTATGVRRVALIGDSIMVQASCALAESLANVGITTSRHAVAGSGLLNGSVDWIAQTNEIMRTEHPDIVIAIFVGNYPSPPVLDAHGAPITVDTPEFFAAWQRRAEQLSAVVRSQRAEMYWVSPPPIASPLPSHPDRLYDGYRTITGDHFLDSGSILARNGDKEVMSLRTCGRMRVVRNQLDRIHLTDDGARIYGQQIAHDLTARLGVLTTPRPC